MIKTQRLILRPLRADDAADLLEYQSNPDVVRFTPWPIRDLGSVTHALEKAISLHKEDLRQSGDTLFLAWELDSIGKVIGQSNMSLLSSQDGLADFGWALHQSFQGRGFAYEASSALLQHAFGELLLNRVIARIDVRNEESIRLAEKLGMQRTSQAPETQLTKGEMCEMWTFETYGPKTIGQ